MVLLLHLQKCEILFLGSQRMELLILDDIHNFEVEYTDFHQSKKAEELFEIHQSAKNEFTEEFPYVGSSDACVSFEPEETLPPITEVMAVRPQNDRPSFKILTDEVSLSTRGKFMNVLKK